MAAAFPPLSARPIAKTIVLFDVDGTLSLARLPATPEMIQTLKALRQKVAIGFVGGSDFVKQQEQLGAPDRDVRSMFDFTFSENGLTAYRLGEPLDSSSFIEHLGEEKYQKLVKFVLHYIADLEIPKKRGTFMEFRRGMVNISPIGRNASTAERNEYEAYDKEHGIRAKLIEELKKAFPDIDLTYSIGGQISFDVFPTGWDKRYCLRHVEAEATRATDPVKFETIHFFGDKAFPGGNDWEIYSDPRVTGHSVKNPDDTIRILKELFGV